MKPQRTRRHVATLRVLNDRTGELHRIRISAPLRIFGRWTVTQTSKPRRVAHAQVTCRNGTIVVRWDKGAGDVEVMRAMVFAVNRALHALAANNRAAISGTCRMKKKRAA